MFVDFMKNWSLWIVLEVACQTVFVNFYLKDLQIMFDCCRSLGPFVAAGDLFGLGCWEGTLSIRVIGHMCVSGSACVV